MIDESQLQTLGVEVAVGEIDRELVRLYAGDEAPGSTSPAGIARASLLNLAVYSENPAAAADLSRIVGDITRETACRAILILADPAGPPSVRSWVQAHCRLSDQGEKTVCTEQITFLLTGADASLVRNTVFSHLDSDLPLVLWWRGELSEAFDERLHSRIDRFIVDSAEWRQPATQFLRLQGAMEDGDRPFVPHDLAYTRCHPARQAIARVFDDPPARRALDQLRGIEIAHRPGHRLSALWLVAWLAGRLGGSIQTRQDDRCVLTTPRWGPVTLRWAETDDGETSTESSEAIAGVAIDLGPGGGIAIRRAAGSGFWRVTQELTGLPPRERLFAGPPRDGTDLIGDILNRAGRNRAMVEALPLMRQLLTR